MRKYGIEHFHIELIEETNNPEEREVFWIENKRSFKNGYNATKGGDGKKYIDYDLVISTYKEVKSENITAKKLNIDVSSVRTILKHSSEKIYSSSEVNKKQYGTLIKQIDKNNEELIQIFVSANHTFSPRPPAATMSAVFYRTVWNNQPYPTIFFAQYTHQPDFPKHKTPHFLRSHRPYSHPLHFAAIFQLKPYL